jgi:hypothetical protein
MLERTRNHPTATTIEVTTVTLSRRQLRQARTRHRRIRMIGASIVVGALVAMGLIAFTGASGQAAGTPSNQTPDLTLSVTPTQNLQDGQSMTLTVTRTAAAPTLQIQGVQTAWCNPDAVLPATASSSDSFTGGFPAEIETSVDGGPVGSVCTDSDHPLNADLTSPSAISPPVNSQGDYPTVTGTILAQVGSTSLEFGGTSLECDSDHPCQLGVAVWTGSRLAPGPIYLLSVPVTFLPPLLSTSCGGTAPGEFTSTSPDRLGQLVTDWTLGACDAGIGGGKVLASNTSASQTDDSSLCQFASGAADLAYSAVGYNATSATDYGASPGFDPSACSTPAPDRPYVAVPVAVNAVVFDHTQTQTAISVNNQLIFSPYPQLDLTVDQAAQLLGADYQWNSSLGQALVRENPNLAGDEFHASQTITSTGGLSGLAATSGTDATTLFATGFLHALAPALLSTASTKELGVASNFGTTTPPYNVFTYTGSPQLIKDMAVANGRPFGLMDADSAAATWGGLADFAMQTPDTVNTPSPTFVAPTAASMDAAVSQMTTQPDGTLLPNPNTTGSMAYPLTFVEYAMAPAQPLLNADCSPNTQSQQDLTDWLDYITGPGQSAMPAGLAPLTSALKTQAQAAIAQVGQAATTGACSTSPTTTTTAPGAPVGSGSGAATTTTTTTAPPAPASSSSGSGEFPTFGGFDDASASLPATAVSSSSPPVATPGGSGGKSAKSGSQNAVRPNTAVQLNGLKASNGTGWLISVLGLLLLVVLIQGLAMLISGKSLRESLAGVGSWFSGKGSHRAGGGAS